MKSLFTVHEGEFLVGDYINRNLGKDYDVWLPTRDRGVDFLVTRKGGKGKPVALQVKFSRSFNDEEGEFSSNVLATSWFKLDPKKVRQSPAHLWVFLFITRKNEKHFVLIPTRELQKRIPRNCGPTWHLYLWACANGSCYQVRYLNSRAKMDAVTHGVKDKALDFSEWVDNWGLLRALTK